MDLDRIVRAIEEKENNNTEQGSEWLDSNEAAEFLRISPFNLRNLTSSGRIPYYKFGRLNRYLRSELRELLMARPMGKPRKAETGRNT